MPRIAGKKTRARRVIEDALSVGMSGNKIQKLLQDVGLGVRRKRLYAEIRSIKGRQVTREKQLKSIPKKYRGQKKIIVKKERINKIYRGSLIISSVPIHSRPFDRHYLGFRLNIFSFDKNEVYSSMRSLKRMFLDKVGDFLRSYQYAKEQTLMTENPETFYITDAEKYNGLWFFGVEKNGSEKHTESGNI